MSGVLKSLSFTEKSGYICNSLTGRAKVGRGKTIVEDFNLTDPWSEVNLPSFMMSYANVKAFKNFISEVKFDGILKDTKVDFKTITYFAPQLEGNRLNLSLDGVVSGYIDNFNISGLRFAAKDGDFSGVLDGSMTGLPEIESTSIDARISKSLMTSEGLGRFLSEWMKDGELDFSRFAKGILFSLNARANGPMNALDVKAGISSIAGSLNADVKVTEIILPEKPIGISGKITTEDLNVGSIIGNSLVGELSMETSLDAVISDSPSLNIKDLQIGRLHMNGYDYEGVRATGKLNDNLFNGWITCHDPNLNFMLSGAVSLVPKGKDAVYGFKLMIGDADLNAMNIDKREKSKMNLSADVNFLKKADGTSYYTGEVDGIYGRLSRKAIQDFQKDFCGLSDRGGLL